MKRPGTRPSKTRTRPASILAELALIVACGCGQPGGTTERAPTTAAGANEAARTPASPETAVPAADPSTGAPAEPRTWNFDEISIGELPPGFVAAVGRWEVKSDETNRSGGQVLAQLTRSEGDVFNVALANGTRARDVDISVRLRSISGRIDQGGGLVWRARDAQNYYVARYNPLEDNFRVYVVEEGRRRMLESETLRVDHGAWLTMRVVMRGEQIECYLDGALHLEASDGTFSEAGQLGLWTKADAVTHFDDLMLTALEAPED